ncbi:unnamed protein product [Acanthoscelides obtectus]|uniref:Uncharacterized protein n=1 Tax=Acanthoscelides obtectus TaxID=200917 RepID=A0A9P0KNI2_ACAOB|nr:unnamed protein product [Acanthoscelides obtectus]CAK1632479.1 hypothetical protein AOBTE_LOCUS7594 [Acanthoscelides obtectus]
MLVKTPCKKGFDNIVTFASLKVFYEFVGKKSYFNMEVDPEGFKEEAVPLKMGRELSGGDSRSKTENMGPLTQMSSEQKTNEKVMMIIDDQGRQIRELMQTIKVQTAKIDSLTELSRSNPMK